MPNCLGVRVQSCLWGLALMIAGCDSPPTRPKYVVPEGMTGVGTMQSGVRGTPDRASSDRDGGAADLADGRDCEQDGECESNHCRNGVCCAGGDCCHSVEDCGDGSGIERTCEHPEQCQGTRSKLVCMDNRCRTRDPQDDDRACTTEVQANRCGAYRAVFCDGERDQREPTCPDSCKGDNDCDNAAQCTDGVCVDRRAPEGEPCSTDGQCASGVCKDGACCKDRASCADRPTSGMGSEEDKLRCLDVYTPGVTTDACRSCTCDRCAPEMLDCYASGDANRDRLCGAVPTCVYFAGCIGDCSDEVYGCYGELCYCGAGNLSCDLPYGPCVEPIAAAAGTRDPQMLRERAKSKDNALYFARTYSECLATECRAACRF